MAFRSIVAVLASTAIVEAFPPSRLAAKWSLPNNDLERRQKGPNYKPHHINMPIDHFPKSPRYEPHTEDTFTQRYVFDSTYYKPGGPVFLYIGGETSAESRFENLQNGIIQILMEATNGLGVILENRYYGHSYPFRNSTLDNLAYLTTEQTIADNAYFAQNIKFPGIDADLTAPKTPWILYGGSLAGAQTAFSIKTYGDILWGGIASSGVVMAKLGYWEWFNPIQKYAPQDCVHSINAIVDKIDHIIDAGNHKAVHELKSIFGLEDLEDIRDFAQAIAFPMGGPMFYPSSTWQEVNWGPYGSPDFFDFCNNVTDPDAPPARANVDHSLAKYTNGEPWKNLGNYAHYFKRVFLPLCDEWYVHTPGCFGTQNKTFWANEENDSLRSYMYTSCSEQGAYIAAPPKGQPSLISRVLTTDYTQQWCKWAFGKPGKYNTIPDSPELWRYNKYGGYDFKADRLAFVDGTIDPWLDVCYHSNDAPQRYSSDLHPELLIAGAGHHWDSYGVDDHSKEPQFVKAAHAWEVRTVKKWLKEFERSHKDEL